jgi:hypothetical protein
MAEAALALCPDDPRLRDNVDKIRRDQVPA